MFGNFLEKSQENGPLQRNDRKTKRTRLKNKRGCWKWESNDSPEISDRGRKQTSQASLQGYTHRIAATGKSTVSTHYFLVDDVSSIWLLLTGAVMSHLAHTQHSLLMENPVCQVLSQLLIA